MRKVYQRIHKRLPPKFATILDFEMGTYVSFTKLLTKRSKLANLHSQKKAFAYSEMQDGILWMFQFASIAEIVAIEILVSNETIKLTLLVLGVWSVFLILGLWASFKVNPHLVEDQYITIQQGSLYKITIPKSLIQSVSEVTTRDSSKCKLKNGELHLPVMSETNMKISLSTPIPCDLPWGMSGDVKEIYFYLDKFNENSKYFR